MIFITHKLEEVLHLAHRCTSLRDGAVVGTVDVPAVSKPILARMMVGREVLLRVADDHGHLGTPSSRLTT